MWREPRRTDVTYSRHGAGSSAPRRTPLQGQNFAICSAACRLPLAACRLPLAACRLPLAACRLPLAACRLPLAVAVAVAVKAWRRSELAMQP
ncbi:6-phosphofructokinase domain protein [Lysobacter antibioticus]|uniref:6-phosphofructokinase domain protein n=1 Tax=Lysobacter antibioticus TaxID=84531 RepID=A0A0S2F8K4_LYSAN|nr:6-phosphofructokinase domain protein [Lysobacter antibioticus]